jgi:hypothetical protein
MQPHVALGNTPNLTYLLLCNLYLANFGVIAPLYYQHIWNITVAQGIHVFSSY